MASIDAELWRKFVRLVGDNFLKNPSPDFDELVAYQLKPVEILFEYRRWKDDHGRHSSHIMRQRIF